MNIAMKYVAGAAAIVLLAAPSLGFAQVYYYAPGATNGAYNYASYIPSSAMPYVNYGYQMQQQSQQQYQSYNPYNYSYSSTTYSQQYSSPSYNYCYSSPTSYSYSMPSYYQ